METSEETVEEYVIEYYESNNGANIPKMQALKTPKVEKKHQIYTCYVKEEPRNVEVSNIRTLHDPEANIFQEENISHEAASNTSIIHESIIPDSVVSETMIPQSCASEINVPEFESSNSNIILEPRKRGRPKKKPISVLTPMAISYNHDVRTGEETLDNINEHLYAGFLGRNRRTTRQPHEEAGWNGSSEDSEREDEDSDRRRGRPFGSIKNRGRGRGRAKPRGRGNQKGRTSRGKRETDVDLHPEHNEQVDGPEEMETDNLEAESLDNSVPVVTPIVKCAKCKEEFPKRDWNKHNLSRHNDTGWLDGQTPIDYEADEKLLKKVLVVAIKKRKGQLICEQCGTLKRSVVGFLSHTRFCGKTETERNELLVQCPKCQLKVKPTSMYTHERNCQKDKMLMNFGYPSEFGQTPELNVSQGKSKRKAAEKAVTRISEFTTTITPSMKKVTPHTIKNYIQKPRMERKIPLRLRNIFLDELEVKGVANCRQPGCEFYGNTLEIICEHYSQCNFEVQENYVCKVCNLHSLIQKEIMDHILDKHSTEENLDTYSDPDHQVLKSESSSEESDIETANITAKIASKLRFLPEKTDEKLRAYRVEFLDREPAQNPKQNIPYSAAFRWTLEFELDKYNLKLFDDLLPNEFILVSEEEGKAFLPELQRSMAIKRPISEIADSSSFDNSQDEWNYWQKFEARIEEGVPTFFVGGPVWAIAWLPIPIPLFSHHPTQYLALSTHPKMESEYAVGQAYSGKNVIQIWNLGSLNYKSNILSIPKLSYAIAHNGGTIWCMEWCPSGCYQDERISNYEKKPGKTKRMGLLAAACSDGFVHIYSLPFPDELQVSTNEKDRLPVYKVNPVQLLVVNIALLEKQKQTWQCTKLSWTKENGHNIIAAGFSNGYIALWNLKIQASYLLKKQGNTTLVNSFRHFYAHNHSVSMISMIPYGEKRFLVSAGLDRCYKVWDLEQPYCVERVTTRGLAVNGAWMNNWLCSVLSYDDALGLSRTNSQLIPLREHSYKYFPVLATNSPTYGMSMSDHANAILQGNLAGEIVAIFPHQVLYKDIENYLNKKRWLCSFVEVTDFKSSETPVEVPGKKGSKEYHYKPTTYAECSERFGISFSEDFITFRSCKAKQLKEKVMPTDQLETVPIEQYPFASVNRVSWNQNTWSHLWFAAGYQNGFVRILNFNSVASVSKMKELLPRFQKAMLEKENRVQVERPEQNEENS